MLNHYLFAGLILFLIGIFLFLTRRNTVMALMGIELMLNAANINFVAFSQQDKLHLHGQMASLFVIVLAATESVVALALILNIYKHFKTIHLSEIDNLKG